MPSRSTRFGGTVIIDGDDIFAMRASDLSKLRGDKVAMIFQEPMVAFDPVFTIGRQIEEAIITHEGVGRAAARARALELLEIVQIPSAARRLKNYSTRAIRRHAAARDDRVGAFLPAKPFARRRTDHCTRRNRSDPNPVAAAGVAKRIGHGRSIRDP